MSTIPNFKSTVAAIIWSVLVYLQSKQYIDSDLALLIASTSTAIFGAINLNNHIKNR